jgi:hypothetical protein
MNPQLLARQLAAEFGATPERLNKLRQTPFPQAVKDLEELKREARVAYKKLAFKYHPDRNPDDPEGAEIRFKLLPQVLKEIEGLRVRAPQRRVIRHFVFVNGYGGGTTATNRGFGRVVTATNEGTTTSTTSTYDARKIPFIRII